MIVPLTLFCIKEDTVANAPEQLVGINAAFGQESLIATLTDIPEYAMPSLIYLATTNEVVYYNDSGTALMKINVTTGQKSSLRLAGSGPNVRFTRLATDKGGNLYAIRNDDNTSLVKIDPKTGDITLVTTISTDYVHFEDLHYLSASNVIGGRSDWAVFSK